MARPSASSRLQPKDGCDDPFEAVAAIVELDRDFIGLARHQHFRLVVAVDVVEVEDLIANAGDAAIRQNITETQRNLCNRLIDGEFQTCNRRA